MTKKITESLVNKKPATAAKLFAEEMQNRIDEISRKTLGRYIERAVIDRDRHIEDATQARASADALNNVRADSDAASQTKRSLRSFLGDQERTAYNKKHKRETGVLKALNRLTKEDLDEEQLDENIERHSVDLEGHPFFQRNFVGGTQHEFQPGNGFEHHKKYQSPSGATLEHLVEIVGKHHNVFLSHPALPHGAIGHGSHAHDALMDAVGQYKRNLKEYVGVNKRNTAIKKNEYEASKKHGKELKGALLENALEMFEVEAPANFWNAGMAKMNPIQVSQKQPAEPGQFKATLTKSPRRLADQGASLEGKPRAVRDETESVATARGPKTIELTGDWEADVPDHQFDPKLDSETEYYPLFSQFKSLGAYPSGPARAWEEEDLDEDELNEISKKTLGSYVKKASSEARRSEYYAGRAGKFRQDYGKELEHSRKRQKGINKAVDRLTKNELSKDTLASYIKKAAEDARTLENISGSTERKYPERSNKLARKAVKRQEGINKAVDRLTKEDLDEDQLNEISKKTLGKYIDAAASKLGGEAYIAGGGSGLGKEGKNKAFRKAVNRLNGIRRAGKKLSEEDKKKVLDSLDEGKLPQKGTAEYHQHRIAKDTVKNPSKALLGGPSVEEARKILKDKFGYTEDQVRKLSEETLQEGLFDPAKQPLLALWDEHARRSDAHGSGSRSEILKRIEDHVAKKHGQEGLKKMRLHTDLTNALKHSLSPDKGHLQSVLGNMRSRCSMGA